MKKQIKFSSLQRFNLEDASDLQGLVDDHLIVQNFGLKGGTSTSALTGGMILSPFSVNSVGAGVSSATANIALNPFSFMLPNGEVVEHTNAALQISYSTLRSAAISASAARTGYLFGNYNDVDTENEPREFWDALSEAEVITNVNTRTVKTPTFVITTTSGQPAAIGGRLWTRLATVSVTSSGGTFKVVNTSAVKQSNEMPGMQYYKPLEVSSSTSSTRFGLGTYWNNIEEMFYKIITNGNSDTSSKTALAYGANPQYSLQGLKAEIDKKTGIGVVAYAKLTFQAVIENYEAFATYVGAETGEPLSAANIHNILLNKAKRDLAYQHFFDPSVEDEDKPGINLSFYKFDDVLTETVGCHFEDDEGELVEAGANLPIYTTQLVGGINHKGSQSLIRLGVSNALDAASPSLINSIFNTNQIRVTVTPSWRQSNTYEIDEPGYAVNGCNSLVQVVKQLDTTLSTDLQKQAYYQQIYKKPSSTHLYVDINCLLASPWMFQYLNETLWRNGSDPNAVTIFPPDFITVHIDILGDLQYT